MIEPTYASTGRELAALRYLDLIDSDSVVAWASEHLESADPDGALLKLACESLPTESATINKLLDELLAEVGDAPMDGRTAGWITARWLAEGIVGGSLEPQIGARKIWWDVAIRIPALEPSLRDFEALASLWEDDATRRSKYDRDIVIEAQHLLSLGRLPPE